MLSKNNAFKIKLRQFFLKKTYFKTSNIRKYIVINKIRKEEDPDPYQNITDPKHWSMYMMVLM